VGNGEVGSGEVGSGEVKSQSGAFNGKVLATCSGTEVRVCPIYCEKHLPYKHTLSSEVLYTATKNLQVLITAIEFWSHTYLANVNLASFPSCFSYSLGTRLP